VRIERKGSFQGKIVDSRFQESELRQRIMFGRFPIRGANPTFRALRDGKKALVKKGGSTIDTVLEKKDRRDAARGLLQI